MFEPRRRAGRGRRPRCDAWRHVQPRPAGREGDSRDGGLALVHVPRRDAAVARRPGSARSLTAAQLPFLLHALHCMSLDYQLAKRKLLQAIARSNRTGVAAGLLSAAAAELRGDHDVVLAAVRRDGAALFAATAELKGNREVVLAAVTQNGLALFSASAELKADPEVVYVAVAQDPDAVRYAPPQFRRDPVVRELAIRGRGDLARLIAARQRLALGYLTCSERLSTMTEATNLPLDLVSRIGRHCTIGAAVGAGTVARLCAALLSQEYKQLYGTAAPTPARTVRQEARAAGETQRCLLM